MNKWLVIAGLLTALQILIDVTKDWSVLQNYENPYAYIVGSNILFFIVALTLFLYARQRKHRTKIVQES